MTVVTRNTIYIFQGIDVGGTNFNTRLLCIEKEIVGPRYEKMKRGMLDKSKEPFSVRIKPFWDVMQASVVSTHAIEVYPGFNTLSILKHVS